MKCLKNLKSEFIILGLKPIIQFANVQVKKVLKAQLKANGSPHPKRKGVRVVLGISAYLDTNLIIEHCWWKFFCEEKGKMPTIVNLVEKGFQGEYDSYISYITAMELSMHLTDWFLLEKVVSSGYSYAYFRQEKKHHLLTKKQKNRVNEIVNYYLNSDDLFYIEIDDIQNEFFEKVKLLVDNYVEFVDALHFVFAQASNCKYFVTKDNELRIRLQKIISEKIIDLPKSPPRIVKPNGFSRVLS